MTSRRKLVVGNWKMHGSHKANAELLVKNLQAAKLEGVSFFPAYYKPFFGKYKGVLCKGVRLLVSDPSKYQPFDVQMALLDLVRRLYPNFYKTQLDALSQTQWRMLSYYFGRSDIKTLRYGRKSLRQLFAQEGKKSHKAYLARRARHLLPEYE